MPRKKKKLPKLKPADPLRKVTFWMEGSLIEKAKIIGVGHVGHGIALAVLSYEREEMELKGNYFAEDEDNDRS